MPSSLTAALICRAAIAFVWIYQGLVPKLLGPHEDEMAMNLALGISPLHATYVAYAAGVAEIALGVAILMLRRSRWPLWLTIIAMPALLAYAAWADVGLLVAAFNPTTINVSVAALAAVALLLDPSGLDRSERPGERTLP